MKNAVPPPSAAAIATLRTHPQFQLAMREAAQGVVTLLRGNRILNTLMNDRARAIFGAVALYLHYSDDGNPGLTVGGMKEFCVRLALCSRGRCEAMLALMRATGFLVSVPNRDGRLRQLAPTEKLLTMFRGRWARNFSAMRHAMPEAANYLAALDDPAFVREFTLALGEQYVRGMRLLDYVPELEMFAERSSGIVILYSLALEGADDGPFPPIEPVPLSISALAARFSVSRKHVLTLLRDAEAEGFFARGGADNGHITLLPPARNGIETLLATVFLYLAQSAEQAFRALDREPGRAHLADTAPAAAGAN